MKLQGISPQRRKEEEKMEITDTVLHMNWTESQYVGDGVYILDSTERSSVPSVALRTDRESRHHVILLEEREFEEMVSAGRKLLEKYHRKAG